MKQPGRKTQYYFFSGKGGVGKTTVSAAAALQLSKKGKVLLISVDPAHSLSDSFERPIGSEIVQVQPNLWAVEIDPARAVAEYKDKLLPKMDVPGLEGVFDVAGMTPGIDELAAFNKFLQYMTSTEYDAVVFDTAPTGHALRFLSLPDVLDSWLGRLIKIRIQFSSVMGLFKKILPFADDQQGLGADHLEAMRSRIAEAKKILSDPKRTHYAIVLIPEAMSILESERSLAVLEKYRIPVERIIVNQVLPANPGCAFCKERRAQQQDRLVQAKKTFRRPIQALPLFPREVAGVRMLERVAKEMYRATP
ncbi:MAG: TRC40/GET3/ArsA family transport-energizing ATPase [Candidatus Aenigmarchaeota archaeon]|nr:TRC40/GET3/ArsA family transport-energizing ATPase [Candidatus Aenigmarchaeota archaeon]